MDEDTSINDKALFAISLLALLVALSTNESAIGKIQFTIFSYSFTIFNLFFYMTLFLFLSVYLFAIDKLKYSTQKTFYLNILKHARSAANISYFFAILLPLLVCTLYLFSCACSFLSYVISYIGHLVPALNFTSRIDNFSFIISAILFTLSFLASFLSTYNYLKSTTREINDQIYKEIGCIEHIEPSLIKKATELYNNSYYASMLIVLNEIISNKLYVKLAEKFSLNKDKVNSRNMIEIAFNEKMITLNQKKLMLDILNLRNKAAHGILEESFDKNLAGKLLTETQKLISDLDKVN